MWVIIAGDLLHGIQSVVGPFDSEQAAEEYSETHNFGHFDRAVYEVDQEREG